MNIRLWIARDWRKLLAMLLLAGGGVAMTVVVWRLIGLVALRSLLDPWPLAYSLYGTQALIGLVLVSLGWVISKAFISAEVAGNKIDLEGGGDDSSATTSLSSVGSTVSASTTLITKPNQTEE